MDYSLILFKRQRKDIKTVGNYDRLNHFEILRMAKTCGNYYTPDKCQRFCGYTKNGVPEFSYKGKKTSLYRLLYHNYIGDLSDVVKIGHKCGNFGCCNIDHIIKQS